MAPPSVEYLRRDPSGSVLHQIVRNHFETFRAEAAHLRAGEGLPRFVEEESQAFLRCGWLAGGFARFVPRPRVNLVLYHGVLAPRAAWRAEVVRRHTPARRRTPAP